MRGTVSLPVIHAHSRERARVTTQISYVCLGEGARPLFKWFSPSSHLLSNDQWEEGGRMVRECRHA